MVRDQKARRWNTRWRPALADKRVLLVGYGAIGRAIEARLLPFETEVVRVARTARQEDTGPVHGFAELPELLPHAVMPPSRARPAATVMTFLNTAFLHLVRRRDGTCGGLVWRADNRTHWRRWHVTCITDA